jgi:hypothetical protein
MVKLGEMYEDSVTGFKGVATGRTTYLYGCVRVGLEGKDKPTEIIWFDEQRLTKYTDATSGGDMPSPSRIDP